METDALTLASVSNSGASSDSDSRQPRISGDGNVVVFMSYAKNLDPRDTNDFSDVYVRNLATGELILVSTNAAGTAVGNRESYDPVISQNGTIVAFTSAASNLTVRDTNNATDVYARNLTTNALSLVSVTSSGNSGFVNATSPSISNDGAVVAFQATGTVLSAQPTTQQQIYTRNIQVSSTRLISANSGGSTPGNGASYAPSISGDGTTVTFTSTASNLTSGLTGSRANIFVRSGTSTTLISKETRVEDNLGSSSAVISNNGSTIVFSSYASSLETRDNDSLRDLFATTIGSSTITLLSDRQPSSTQLTSPVSGSTVPNTGRYMSHDGRFVAFETEDQLVPEDQNDSSDVYVRDRLLGTVTLASMDPSGQKAMGFARQPVISASGSKVAFLSTACSWTTVCASSPQIHVRDLVQKTTAIASISASGQYADGPSHDLQMDSSGDTVAFATMATNLDVRDSNSTLDVYYWRATTGNAQVASLTTQNSIEADYSFAPVLSADGGMIVFKSWANLDTARDGNNEVDIYARDLIANETKLVSARLDGSAIGSVDSFTSSADGKRIVFESFARGITSDDTNDYTDIFLRDLSFGRTHLVSKTGGLAFSPSINLQGDRVAFVSDAAPGDLGLQIYVYDFTDDSTTLASVNLSGVAGNASSFAPSLSGDGSAIVFASAATNLDARAGDGTYRLLLAQPGQQRHPPGERCQRWQGLPSGLSLQRFSELRWFHCQLPLLGEFIHSKRYKQ